MAVVHQILPTLEYGDAISNYALVLRRVLRGMGHTSHIYARHINPWLRWHGKPLRATRRYAAQGDAIWLYHYSIGSEITNLVRDFAGRLVLIYYNITPPMLAAQSNSHLAARLHAGQEELKSLVDRVCIAVGSSEFNRAALIEAGFRNTDVLPIILDYAKYDEPPGSSSTSAFRDGGVNFLTVGRIYPHKKIEHVIGVFHYYQNCINPRSRLFIVGDAKGMEEYQAHLRQLCGSLALSNVHFTGKVSFRELLSYYQIADVYLCMSEHEGFCVPLLESMYLGVPVIANKCTAIGETLGDAGVLVREKRFDEIAEMAHLLISERALRERIIARQKERARFFSEDYLTTQLNRILAVAQSSA